MASKGLNKVMLIGNLGNDPEARYLPSGSAVVNVSIATSDYWKDKQTGEMQERTEWHRVVFFNRLAEITQEYLKKGSKVYVEGRLQTRKWQDKNGVDRYSTEIIANEMQMLDSKGGGQSGQYGYQNNQDAAQSKESSGQQSFAEPASKSSQTPQTENPVTEASFDDDIPF